MQRTTKLLVITLLLLFASAGALQARIIEVPRDYQTIQTGIDNAEESDTVIVFPGTYVENINFNGKIITLASRYLQVLDPHLIEITIIDGSQNGSVVTFENQENEETRLVGFTIRNGSGRLWINDNRTFFFAGGGVFCREASPIIQSCWIIDNSVDNGEDDSYGGGIYCNESEAVISNCIIERNVTGSSGGGIYFYSSTSDVTDCFLVNNTAGVSGGAISCSHSNICIENCTIKKNQGNAGGGIYCSSSWYDQTTSITNCSVDSNFAEYGGGGICYNSFSSDSLANCYIIGNTTNGYGGGIYCLNRNMYVTNCRVTGNTAICGGGISSDQTVSLNQCHFLHNEARLGGGFYCYDNSDPRLLGCLIIGNHAETSGGGFYCDNSSSPRIVNCTIHGNTAPDGGALWCRDASSPVITNCILWGNDMPAVYFSEDEDRQVISVSYTDMQGGRDAIETNDNGLIDWGAGNIDADPLFVDADNDDYHLTGDSPCIDAGTDVGMPFVGEAPDMGAFEYGAESVEHLQPILPVEPILHAAFPNPFNSVATIQYMLPHASDVRLILIDYTGRVAREIAVGSQSAGYHSITIDGSNLSTGLYIARLHAGGGARYTKLVCVK